MLLILLLITPAIIATDNFWLDVEMEQVDWVEGCLTTSLCSHPRFQVIKDLLPVNERISMSWSITDHFVKESHRPFVSTWPSGRPEDISMSAQVIGTDRTYGFPRICDQSPSVRIFPDEVKKDKDGDNKMRLSVKGKCFNATMSIRKHTERCPWCPDPKELNLIAPDASGQASGPAGARSPIQWPWILSDDRIVHAGVLILAIVAVMASTAFAVILVMYLRSKRNAEKMMKKSRFHPYISVKGHEVEEQNRYDMPWEQQQQHQNRPLTYWMTSSNKSDSTMPSPLDSASSIGGQQMVPDMYHSTYTRDGYQTYRPPPPSHPPMFPPQTQLFTTAPYQQQRHIISPISSRNDDSGLESV